MTHAKKKFEELTPGEMMDLVGRPVYVGLTTKDTGEKAIQAIGVVVNIQEYAPESRALISLTDGENTTPVGWDTDQYVAEIIWETYDE